MDLSKMCRYMCMSCVTIILLYMLYSCKKDDEELVNESIENSEGMGDTPPYTSYVKLIPRNSKDEIKYLKIKNAKFYGKIPKPTVSYGTNEKHLRLEIEDGGWFDLTYPMYQYHDIEDVCFDAGTYDYWYWNMHSEYYDYVVIDNFDYIGYIPKSQHYWHSGEFTISYSGKQIVLDLEGEYYVSNFDSRTYKEIVLHYEGGYVKGPITYQN